MNFSAGFSRLLNILAVIVALIGAGIVVVLQFAAMPTMKLFGFIVLASYAGLPNYRRYALQRGLTPLRVSVLAVVFAFTASAAGAAACFTQTELARGMGEFVLISYLVLLFASPYMAAFLIHLATKGAGRAGGYVVEGFKQPK